ncbi:MAG: metallophosphoesterase [Myxococcales bacterium]|nr:metallophosphoesterase [Polyangiaceae bacterium]MDW8250372.1 metallophosphoesterase [Myxococcales bacterium]
MSEPIRKRGKVDFPSLLLRATVVTHLLLIPPYAELARRLGLSRPWLLGTALAVLLMLPIQGKIRTILWDEPRAPWKISLVDEPYFIHWCATFFGAPFLLVGYALSAFLDGVQGRLPEPPGPCALGFYLAMVTVGAYAIKIRRRWVTRRRFEVTMEGLDPAFDGFRIVHLSDLHIGGLLPAGLAERWIHMANEESPDLTVITGDLVTSGVNFHDQIAAVLGRLQAQEGTVVSLGNHDYFGEPEALPLKLQEAGLRVLRNASVLIERGGAKLRLAAVDDTWTARADLEKALAGPKPAPTVLLAHDPNLFDRAADLGADLVLSGHTHAGQLAMPFLVERINLARIAYRYTYGFYRRGRSTLYVHAGLGTTGPPARLGAAPEIVTFILRSSPAHSDSNGT